MGGRRGRGEGTVFRRGDGLWVGALTFGYDSRGKRRRQVVYGATKAEVLERLARLLVSALDGTMVHPQRLTVAGYLARWLEDTVRTGMRESTYQMYEITVRCHIAPSIGGVQLPRVGAMHVHAMLAEMERNGASPRQRQIAFKVFRRAMRQAVRWKMIPHDPCAAVTAPRVPHREMQVLTPEQARRFLAAACEDRLYGLYAVLLGCGLRLGEALGLTWPDVDLERGTITVRRQLCDVNGRLWLQEPKTERSRRTIDLPAFVADALRDHQQRMKTEGHLLNDRLLVFVDTDGKPIRRTNLRKRSFLPLLRRAGLPRIRLHDLRHTAATLHLLQGTHPSVVQHMLGHARVSITLDVYSHVLPTLGKEAAQRIDALLRAPRPGR